MAPKKSATQKSNVTTKKHGNQTVKDKLSSSDQKKTDEADSKAKQSWDNRQTKGKSKSKVYSEKPKSSSTRTSDVPKTDTEDDIKDCKACSTSGKSSEGGKLKTKKKTVKESNPARKHDTKTYKNSEQETNDKVYKKTNKTKSRQKSQNFDDEYPIEEDKKTLSKEKGRPASHASTEPTEAVKSYMKGKGKHYEKSKSREVKSKYPVGKDQELNQKKTNPQNADLSLNKTLKNYSKKITPKGGPDGKGKEQTGQKAAILKHKGKYQESLEEDSVSATEEDKATGRKGQDKESNGWSSYDDVTNSSDANNECSLEKHDDEDPQGTRCKSRGSQHEREEVSCDTDSSEESEIEEEDDQEETHEKKEMHDETESESETYEEEMEDNGKKDKYENTTRISRSNEEDNNICSEDEIKSSKKSLRNKCSISNNKDWEKNKKVYRSGEESEDDFDESEPATSSNGKDKALSDTSEKSTKLSKNEPRISKALHTYKKSKVLTKVTAKPMHEAKVQTKGGEKTSDKNVFRSKHRLSKIQAQQNCKSQILEIAQKVKGQKNSTAKEDIISEGKEIETDNILTISSPKHLFSKQSQIILTLRSKHKSTRAKITEDTKLKFNREEKEPSIDTQEAQSIKSENYSKKYAKKKSRDASFKNNLKEPIVTVSAASSPGCSMNSSSAEKHMQFSTKKKKIGKAIGKVKLASNRNQEESSKILKEEVIEDEPAPESVSNHNDHNNFRRVSALRRVTGWLNKKITQKKNNSSKMACVTKAVGISGWLLSRLGLKQKSSKNPAFRRRMAFRIASSRLVNRRDRPSDGADANLNIKTGYGSEERYSLVDNGRAFYDLDVLEPTNSMDMHEQMDEEPDTCDSPVGDSNSSQLVSFDEHIEMEEKNNATDAKYAIVLPRVHRIVKSKVMSSCKNSEPQQAQGLPVKTIVMSLQPKKQFIDLATKPLIDGPKKQSIMTNTQLSLGYSVEDSKWRKRDFLKCGENATSPKAVRTAFHKDPHQCKMSAHMTKLSRFLGTETQAGKRLQTKDTNCSQYRVLKLSHFQDEQGRLPQNKGPFPPKEDASEDMVTSFFEDDVHQEVASIMGNTVLETPADVHWAQNKSMRCDPLDWLNSELLLPHPTIENLSKWTIYKDQDLSKPPLLRISRERWEAEDNTESNLEIDLKQKQVVAGDNSSLELDNTEDLSRLEHIFAIADAAYTQSQDSDQEQCILLSGQSGSGKTEATKFIAKYLTALYQSKEDRIREVRPSEVLPILESFGNAKTVLNDNSSRFGKFLHIHIRHGLVVGTAFSHYLLEKSRVVFQAQGERSYHVFYEMLAGLSNEQKQALYVQEAETYFYVNQGGVCQISGKEDEKDFLILLKSLQVIGVSDDQLNSIWAILSSILQLGNVCFTSYENEFYELAAIFSDTEMRIVANLLQISADLLQRIITHRVTETSYDRIFSPLSVENAIDARDAIAKTLYSLLFDWLLERINEWLIPKEMDNAIGIVDIYGFEDLGVNSFEQLCINYANEQLQQFFNRAVVVQEQAEYSREELNWIPFSTVDNQSCLDLICAKPHGILRILDDQTSFPQATDHTFLQKCHYHHGNNPRYSKPKLPLPVFTVQHYAGPVTYQVHKFLTKNHDQLRPEVFDLFIQSRHKMVFSLFKKAKEKYNQQKTIVSRGKGHRANAVTLASRFQQSLQELTAKLERCNTFFIHCIKPNPKKVFMKDNLFQLLENQWTKTQKWAVLTIQKNIRGFITRKNFRFFRKKVIVIQAHIRGHQTRKRYKRLKKSLEQFWAMVLISKSVVQRKLLQQSHEDWEGRKHPQAKSKQAASRGEMDVGLLEIPAELAALLRVADGHQHGQANKIVEVSPPQVKAEYNLSLPADINSFPFSNFVNLHFQEPRLQPLEKTLQHPLTHLEGEEKLAALEIFKLVMRFMADVDLQGRKETTLGNYIAKKGLSNPKLRNEIFCQLANQLWQSSDSERCHRGWVLLTNCLGCFTASPSLEKPLLKYVSDYGLGGYKALCQHKALTAMQQTHTDPEAARNFPPTQLEWTANERKGKMVLDVYTYSEETFKAEVDSWTTGEQFATWILKSRGIEEGARGWSVSMFTGEDWRDLAGCDYVMDLIGETEDISEGFSSDIDYVITPQPNGGVHKQTFTDDYLPFSNGVQMNIPPAPDIQAPRLPPPLLNMDDDKDVADPNIYSTIICGDNRSNTRSHGGLDNYVDDLFDPVLSYGTGELERRSMLNQRMKGGGGIGPTHPGGFLSPGVSYMPNYSIGVPGMAQAPQMPGYAPMPVMNGMMPAMQPMGPMPMMQPVPTMAPLSAMPAMMMPQPSPVPQILQAQVQPVAQSVDHNQLAAQQQAFINQQALLLAQQMTLQAMNLSQQRQQQPQPPPPPQPSPQQSSFTSSKSSPVPIPAPKPQKVNRKQPVVKEQPVVEEEPPPINPQENHYEQRKTSEIVDPEQYETFQQKRQFFQKFEPVRPPPPPAPVQTETKIQKVKEAEPKKPTPVVNPLEELQRQEPSQEIRNIIQLYQNKPLPQPEPFKPVRKPAKPFLKKNDPKNEALAILRLKSPNSPTELSAPSNESGQDKKIPPPTAEKKARLPFMLLPPPPPPTLPPDPNQPAKSTHSPSIHKKQQPLLELFVPPAPSAPPPPPPPPFSSSPPPEGRAPQVSTARMVDEDNIKTQFYKLTVSVYFSYNNVPWKLFLRKEVFYPKEKFGHPFILNLLCEQIMRDTYSDSCVRISKEERRKMRDLLAELQVGTDVSSLHNDGLKKRIILAARDNWANYFSRLFPASGDYGSRIQFLGVSHRGIRLLKIAKAAVINPEHFKVLRSYSYADLLSVEVQDRSTLEFSLKNEQLVLYSPKARQIKDMIDVFLTELRKDSNCMIALKSYITDDRSLLTFKKGDIIKVLPMDGLQPGWEFGSIGGRSGLFPTSHAQPTAAPDYYNIHMDRREEQRKSIKEYQSQNASSDQVQTTVLGNEFQTGVNSVEGHS
ncbi:uncharacterized protein LOC102351335 [Latimeria chalumnae]|uniref:uncharacterized protein LOC102351335 n=1 Tax=Latimeria chalumnae TaxID=7897 RepID=UPI00313D46F2